MTTLRSTPCGRGGAGGTSPAAIRLVQSPNIASVRSFPILLTPPIMPPPACPDWMRRSQALDGESKLPSAAGISRVALLPSWWHDQQLSVLIISMNWACDFIFGEMPFPPGPVPGNSLLSGTLSSEYQKLAG